MYTVTVVCRYTFLVKLVAKTDSTQNKTKSNSNNKKHHLLLFSPVTFSKQPTNECGMNESLNLHTQLNNTRQQQKHISYNTMNDNTNKNKYLHTRKTLIVNA